MKSSQGHSQQGGVLPSRLLKISLLAMTGLHLAAPGPAWTSAPGSLAGLLPIALGLLMYRGAERRCRKLGTPSAPRQTPSVLVTRGPFRISRHPMYLGMVLGLFGYAVLLGTLSPMLVVPVVTAFLDRRYVRAEEACLAQSFGEDYEAYCGKTARWL